MTFIVRAHRTLATTALSLFLATIAAAQTGGSTILSPLALPGPYPVACSNVAQDFTRVAPGEDVQAYWEVVPRDNGTLRQVTDLLSDPANALIVTVNAPANGELYGSYAGRSLPFAALVCYPTTADNPRPDYSLPTGRAVPHMQRGAEAPLFPGSPARFPLLLFSHGYGGSPLSNDYIYALTVFASYGYVVAAPFHGDWQYNNAELDSFGDVLYLITHLRDYLAMQALRPLALTAVTDLLLTHPQWRDHIDASRIGGFGASMGGESMMLMAGAGLTTSLGFSWTQVERDPRLKAAVGYVPYFGQPIFPAFGRDQHGLDGIALPFMAVGGTADTTAPIALTLQGMNLLAGPRELIALNGVTHRFDAASTADIFTWLLTFLDAELRGNAAARDVLRHAASVAGGGDDHVVLPYNGSAAPTQNFGGLWWAAPPGSESGWGIHLAHQGDVIVATWATYDATGKPWWLTMAAARGAGNTYAGTLYETRGPAFNAVTFDPSGVSRTAVGTGTLTFADGANGTFSYTLNGVTQTKAITPVAFASPVPVCTFGSAIDPAGATNYQGLWWAAPAGVESGWSVSVTHQGGTVVSDWFTYDAGGNPIWLSAALFNTAGTNYAGTLIRTTGPAWNSAPFNPANVVRSVAGTASINFTNGNSGLFTYALDGVTQTKPITRFVFAGTGTICQ